MTHGDVSGAGADRTDDEGLERHLRPGEMPSDVQVQAERQEEGVEAEDAEASVESARRAERAREGDPDWPGEGS
jgi:hypothetical protein